MDRLSKRAAKARELGMSYGQYIAAYHPANGQARPKEVSIRSFGKTCVVCGKKLTGKQRKYCSSECTLEAFRTPKTGCEICGKLICGGPRMKYCSPECRSEGRRRRKKN